MHDDVTLCMKVIARPLGTVSEGLLLILRAGSRIDVVSVIGGVKWLEVVVSVERCW